MLVIALAFYIFLIIDYIFNSHIFYFPFGLIRCWSLPTSMITFISTYILALYLNIQSWMSILSVLLICLSFFISNFCSDLKDFCCLVLVSSGCLLFLLFISNAVVLSITFAIAAYSYYLVHCRGRQINAFQCFGIYQPLLLAMWLEGKADILCLESTMVPTSFLIPFNIGLSILTFAQHTASFIYWYYTSKYKETCKRSLFHPNSD